MILAAPFVIPFAEIIGVSIAALGMAKATDKVQEFIEKNPEQAQKIFAMIMPEQGLANILKNKSDDGEESSETEVEVEVETPKLTGKEKGMRMREAALQKQGSYQDKNATGNFASKRGRMIKAAEELGLASPDLKDNYKKSNFDYKKYFRKADGGIMQAKRKNFRGGGMDQGNASNQAQSASMGGGGGGGNARENYRTQQYNKPNPVLDRIKSQNKPDKSPFAKFKDHDQFTDALKFTSGIPNYHQLGGLDFMARFPGTNPSLAKALAKGYQYTTEGARALTNEDISFADAFSKAKEETRLNNIGIDDFSNPESATYTQYQDLVPETGKVVFANGGGVGSMMQPKSKTGKAVNELQAKAPEGEFLAYINPDEASMLKRAGGSGEPVNGIPSFRPQDMGNAANQAASAAMGGGSGGPNNDGTGDYSNATQTANHVAAQKAARQRVAADNRKKQIKALEQTYGTGKNAGIFGGFNPLSMIAGLIGGPFAGLAMRGITSLGKNFKGLNKKMRGTNPDGTTRTQAEYEADLQNRRNESRRDRLQNYKDKGNTVFGFQTNTPFSKGQQEKLDYFNSITGVNNNGIKNTTVANNMIENMPKANITGLSNNDFDGVQNVDRSITSGQINEFGDNRNINMDEFGYGGAYGTSDQGFVNNPMGTSDQGFVNDPYGTSDQGFVNNPYGTSDQGFVNNPMGTSDQGFVNDPYGTSDQGFVNNPMGTSDQGFVNNPMGTSDQGFVNDPYGTSDQGFQGIGETTAGLPGSNVFAGNYSQNAVSKQLYGEEYDVLDPFTQQKIDSLIEQVGTKSTGELASNNNYDDADFVNKYGYPLTAGLVNNISPVVTQEYSSIGSLPKGAGFIMDGDLGSLQSTVDFSDMINKDINPELNYTGNFLDGKVNIDGTYKDGSGNINAGYNNNGFRTGVNYDGDSLSGGLQFNKQYEGGNPLRALLNSIRGK